MFVSNIFSIIIAVFPVMYRNMCQFTCTEQTELGDRDVCRALQNCGSLATLLTPRIWRWLLDFWKICGHSLTSEFSDSGIDINTLGDNFF
jgi:hypothetical protein